MADAYIVYAAKGGAFHVLKRCSGGCYHDHVETRDGMVAARVAGTLNAASDAIPAGDSE